VWNGSNGFTIVPQTGMQATASIAVGDFYGDGTYSAVYGDMNAGVNFPNVPNWVNGIYLYHLSNLVPVGNPVNVGNPYFNDNPQWAQYVGYVNPHGETHSYHTFLDDFNHDGQLDIVVQDSIYPFAPNGGPNILQMFQNDGSYQFTDVTDLLDPKYDPYTAESDYDPQVRDIDHSGINSYLLAALNYSTQVAASNYLIVNDGSGNLQPALHETLNRYGQQVVAWLASQPSFAASHTLSAPQPNVRAYQTADGKLNFVAIVWIRNGTPATLEQYVFVNVPLRLDLPSLFTKPMVVKNRNGSHLIRTFAGDDTIYSGNNGGYSKVDGGLGTNTVVYSGSWKNYSISSNAEGSWVVNDNVGQDGTDTLIRIQRLKFSDTTVALNLGAPTITGVSSAAGGQPGAVSGSLVSIYGSNFTPLPSDDWSRSISNGQLPTQLDGTTVTIGGKLAAINAITPGQINVQAPDAGAGNVQVIVTTPAGSSAPFITSVQPYNPAFFPWPNGQPAATHLDYSIAAKNGTFSGMTTIPAKPGEVIILWATGLGPTNPAVPAGHLPGANAGAPTQNPVMVTLNGGNVPVLGAALSGYPGVYQIAIQIPASTTDGDYPLVASVNNVSSPKATLAVHQ